MSPRVRSLVLALASLVGIALTLTLGRWQLQRAAYKEDLSARMQDRAAMPVLPQPELLALDAQALATHLQQRVQLRGTWLPDYTIALDNRQMRDKQGFFVLTPLQLEAGGAVVMVQRGWLARDFLQREHLLPFDTPEGVVELVGTITQGPARLYDFDARETGRIRQNLDIPSYRAESGLALRDFLVVQQGPPSEGLLRDWPLPGLGIERHYGYAFQWFSLAVLIAGLYLWFQWIRPMRRAKDPVSDDKA